MNKLLVNAHEFSNLNLKSTYYNIFLSSVRYGSGCCTPHYTHETYTFGLF